MTMKRKLLVFLIAALTPTLAPGAKEALANRAPAHSGRPPAPYVQEVVPVPRPDARPAPGIDVWTRRGEGAALRPGQKVDIFFRARRDAFVLVYNIDTRGRVRLLFPRSPHDDGWVPGRTRIAIPGPHAGYELRVVGPPGVERIVALASNRPLVHRWREVVDRDLARHAGLDPGPYGRVVDRVVFASAGEGKPELRRVAPVRPQVVPTPIRAGREVRRDETWFRVVRGRPWYGREHGHRYDDDWGD
jgi:hypothetical protein